ncbi:MAG: Hint domain-containing protein [Boseongicola sp.]|nr:Hint domain-containing protein [Boseongicola sp.]MDD9977315.1 Hint domain-containing protein [Boseongicola sp.]
MNMMARPKGTFVISWSQTEIDGLSGSPVSAVERGTAWRWTGEPVRIDAATQFDAHAYDMDDDRLRRHAAAGARKIVGRALVREGVRTPFLEDETSMDQSFTLTDGAKSWVATLIDMPEIARPLLMFVGEMPPADTALWVLQAVEAPSRLRYLHDEQEGVVCFTPGTWLETPEGPRAIEELVAGDKIVTKDHGAQEILWVGHRHVSGARLYAMPDLRPVRIRQDALGNGRPTEDLIVSPDHRMLVQGAAALALWGEHEVLVAARDLIDDMRITRDLSAKSATYIHLLLPQHGILVANGMETESFHPGATSLSSVADDQLDRLFDVIPELRLDADAYGPMSRRVLSRAEAALVARVS